MPEAVDCGQGVKRVAAMNVFRLHIPRLHIPRIRSSRVIAVAAAALAIGVAEAAAPAWPDAFPSRSIHLIVNFAAGGTGDIVARLIGAKLSTAMNQSVVVENRPGAGGTLGARDVVNAATRAGTCSPFARWRRAAGAGSACGRSLFDDGGVRRVLAQPRSPGDLRFRRRWYARPFGRRTDEAQAQQQADARPL